MCHEVGDLIAASPTASAGKLQDPGHWPFQRGLGHQFLNSHPGKRHELQSEAPVR